MELVKPTKQRTLLILAWIGVIVTAAFLRFDDLAKRPMHADEATGAHIMAKRMEGEGGKFNPKHYHGPLLADLTMPVCLLRGESTWEELSKLSLRLVTASAGLLLVLVPLMWRSRLGDVAALAAAALLAVSPLLVYFSRMFIHESLLVLFGAGLMGLCMAFPRWGIPGVLLGLMFAAKETFAISVMAWGTAIGVLPLLERKLIKRENINRWLGQYGRTLALCVATASLTAVICYTHGFTHLQGALDAVKTYFVYETVSGHDKPWGYYLQLLALPEKAAGVWWYGTPVVMLALFAYGLSWTRQVEPTQRRWIQLLAHSAVAHLVIYSLISYKTPWLACLPWALICWLAGMALVNFNKQVRMLQVLVLMFLAATLWTQFKQTRMACERLHSDARNPYAYVPSRLDLEKMEKWLGQLRAMEGGEPLNRVAVIGSGYWPLPWYLRDFEQVGYWHEGLQAPDDLESYPVVLMMPMQDVALRNRLKKSHVPLPRGLRDGVALQMYLSRKVWDQWMETP